MRFRVVSDKAEEVHVHGYDIKKDLQPNKTETVSFKATITGIFEIELEGSATQLGVAQGRAVGQPLRSHRGTPPSTTCHTAAAPWRWSRLAPTAARWPDAQTTAMTGVAVELAGHVHEVVVGHEDRARDVAGVPLVALADVEHLQPSRSASQRATGRRASTRSMRSTGGAPRASSSCRRRGSRRSA